MLIGVGSDNAAIDGRRAMVLIDREKEFVSESTWKLGGLKVSELGRRVWKQLAEDEVFGRAAQLSYYFLLALFPLLLFLTTLLGYFAENGRELRDGLLGYFQQMLPPSASTLVNGTLDEVIADKGGGKLTFGVLAALWAASKGMGAITSALNVAYDVKETRPWWKVRLIAIVLTLSLSLLILTALVLVLFGHQLGMAASVWLNLGQAFEWAWTILQWPISLAFMLLAFALVYYWAPNLKATSWHWITPGALAGVFLWVTVSLGFRSYLGFFDSFSKTYGSLGAVIILMLWFYFTGVAVLIGGEINSEIERAALSSPAKKESR